jgi:hypothetical protein
MNLEEVRARVEDPLEIKSRADAQNTREALEALGARLPIVIQINTGQPKRTRRKCRLCGKASRCQQCRKTQRDWNDMQAALDAMRNGTDQTPSLLDEIMLSSGEES